MLRSSAQPATWQPMLTMEASEAERGDSCKSSPNLSRLLTTQRFPRHAHTEMLDRLRQLWARCCRSLTCTPRSCRADSSGTPRTWRATTRRNAPTAAPQHHAQPRRAAADGHVARPHEAAGTDDPGELRKRLGPTPHKRRARRRRRRARRDRQRRTTADAPSTTTDWCRRQWGGGHVHNIACLHNCERRASSDRSAKPPQPGRVSCGLRNRGRPGAEAAPESPSKVVPTNTYRDAGAPVAPKRWQQRAAPPINPCFIANTDTDRKRQQTPAESGWPGCLYRLQSARSARVDRRPYDGCSELGVGCRDLQRRFSCGRLSPRWRSSLPPPVNGQSVVDASSLFFVGPRLDFPAAGVCRLGKAS